jgi:putative Mg2+ transporter-C (MgtC) family protein
MKLATSDTWVELFLLLIAFALSMLIGIERQLRQKSAGVRTPGCAMMMTTDVISRRK